MKQSILIIATALILLTTLSPAQEIPTFLTDQTVVVGWTATLEPNITFNMHFENLTSGTLLDMVVDQWSISGDTVTTPTMALPVGEGLITLRVSATDSAGNQSPKSLPFTFNVAASDTTAPATPVQLFIRAVIQ